MCTGLLGSALGKNVWGGGQREEFICGAAGIEPLSAWGAPLELYRIEARGQTPERPNVCMLSPERWLTLGEAASLSRGRFLERDSAMSYESTRPRPEGGYGFTIPAPPLY